MEKEYFDLEDFSKRFRVDNNPANDYLFPFWEDIVAEMKLVGRMGNATMYEETMRSVKNLCGHRKIKFQDITNTFLNKYEAWLRSRGRNGWRDQH